MEFYIFSSFRPCRYFLVLGGISEKIENQGIFCVGTRGYGVPGNENDESINFVVCMSVLY